MSPDAPAPLRSEIAVGVLLALGAAATFGLSTPLVQALGVGLGPFSTAGLLYAGAAGLAATSLKRRDQEAPLRLAHLPRLAAVALCGAFIAPVALAAGLQSASGVAASLLLNLEAVFTVALGALLFREPLGGRVIAAASLIAAGGALVVLAREGGAAGLGLGLGLVALAPLFWALDNTLSRPLADLDPSAVVAGKGLLGALASAGVAVALGEPAPALGAAAGLLATGAVGYGGSLRLYLLAQRRLGAARTGSVFAVAPFLGAGLAAALGQPLGGAGAVMGGLLMAVGVWLHLTEAHEHEHLHEAITHEHPHRHDDGHHDDHSHPEPVEGAHSHVHSHAPRRHSHAHGEDLHHRHSHP